MVYIINAKPVSPPRGSERNTITDQTNTMNNNINSDLIMKRDGSSHIMVLQG